MTPHVLEQAKKRSYQESAADILRADASTNPARWSRLRRDNAHSDVRNAWATNCVVSDPGLAVVEIMWIHSRQRTNCRVSASYHLVVSFADGEEVGLDLLKRIEQHLVEAVSLSHHPRIAAEHIDGQCRRLHVLVSRVDPISTCVVVPKYDHRRLMQAARIIEDRYGLVSAYHGELHGRNPIPCGRRIESRDAFLGDVDPLLATHLHARFAQAESMRRAKLRADLTQVTLDINQLKNALLAEEARAIDTINGCAQADGRGATEARNAIRQSTHDQRRKLIAFGKQRRKELKSTMRELKWQSWLESEAARGDQGAAELLRQLQHRASYRRTTSAESNAERDASGSTVQPSRHRLAKGQTVEGPDHEDAN